MTTISFLPDLLTLMYLQAEQAFPNEVCGILIGRELSEPTGSWRLVERLIQTANIAENARQMDRFRIDPKDFLAAQRQADDSGQVILGFYHSHPNAMARPSAIDLENAWPVYSYVILGVFAGRTIDVTSWILNPAGGGFIEQTLVDATAAAMTL